MSDYYDAYAGIRLANQIDAAARRQATTNNHFAQAADRAKGAGLDLIRHTDAHYSLRSPAKGWILNIHPGNRRLYHDRHRNIAPPFLRLQPRWTLAEVVEAAIRQWG